MLWRVALLGLADLGLGSGEAGDGHAERAAGHVVNANGVEEEDGLGVTAVLTADTAGEAGALAAALVHTNLHQLANGLLVNVLERVAIKDALGSGEGIFAAAVCRAAVTEVALFPDRFEEVGADRDVMREVTEAAVEFMDEVEKGRVQVPELIREELRAAIESL